jgi:hypothetical protein
MPPLRFIEHWPIKHLPRATQLTDLRVECTIIDSASVAVLPCHLKTLTIRDDCWGFLDWKWSDNEYLKLISAVLDQG